MFNKSNKNNIVNNNTSIIERFNRTLREKIDKYMISNNTNTFIK